MAYQLARRALFRKAASPLQAESSVLGQRRTDSRGFRVGYSRRPPSESGQQAAAEVEHGFFPAVHEVLRSPGAPLDDTTLAQVGSRFNHDFSRVRVHTDRSAAEAARAVGAGAFTFGYDVVFGDHRFAPRTADGMQLLAHELAHVLQQPAAPAGLAGTIKITSPADSCERQADAAARGIAQPITPLPSRVLCRQPTTSEAKKPKAEAGEKPKTEAAKKPKIAKRTEQVKVGDCREAVEWLRAHEEAGDAEANVVDKQMQIKFARHGSKVTASVDVRLELDADTSSTRVSVLHWPNMTAAEQKAVKAFTDALQAHEDGHIKLAEEFFRQGSKTIQAEGDSEEDAVGKLKESVSEFHELVQKELDSKTAQYDKKTDHGRNQEAVGRENTVLDCPVRSH